MKKTRFNCRWARAEVCLLHAQLSEGKSIDEVAVPGRTKRAMKRIAIERKFIKPKFRRRKWTKSALRKLKSAWRRSGNIHEVARKIGRGFSSVELQLVKLGLHERQDPSWTSGELKSLAKQWEREGVAKRISIPNRTPFAIHRRLIAEGLLVPDNLTWADGQVAALKVQWAEHRDPQKIVIPGKTLKQVKRKIVGLGLHIFKRNWTEDEDRILIAEMKRCENDVIQVKVPGRETTGIACRVRRLGLVRKSRVWTKRQKTSLRRQFKQLGTSKGIVIAGKSSGAICCQLRQMKLLKSGKPLLRKWRAEDDAQLIELSLNGTNSRTQMATALKRTIDAVINRLAFLRKGKRLNSQYLQLIRGSIIVPKALPQAVFTRATQVRLKTVGMVLTSRCPELSQRSKDGVVGIRGFERRASRLPLCKLAELGGRVSREFSGPQIDQLLRITELSKLGGSNALSRKVEGLNQTLTAIKAEPKTESLRGKLTFQIFDVASIPEFVASL